jgi:hypothetical protein
MNRNAIRLFASLSSAEKWAWLCEEVTLRDLFGEYPPRATRLHLAALIYAWGE